ncbi:MAG: hypothetical protein ACM3JH_00630 [Acidithiobacillales bacterium]
MASIERLRPDEIFQPEKSYKCWAAALVAWVQVTQSKAAFWLDDMDEAVRLFAKDQKLGGLDIKGEFRFMAEMVGMNYRRFLRHEVIQLTGGLLYSLLKNKGHLYIVVSGGSVTASVELAHAGVIWAIRNSNGPDAVVKVMDPIYGWVPDRPLSYYHGVANAILGWPY